MSKSSQDRNVLCMLLFASSVLWIPTQSVSIFPPAIPSTDQFMCQPGYYITMSWVCDGELDCPDGSDESNCYDTPKHPSDAGSGFSDDEDSNAPPKSQSPDDEDSSIGSGFSGDEDSSSPNHPAPDNEADETEPTSPDDRDTSETDSLIMKIVTEQTPSSFLDPPKYAAASSLSLTCVVQGLNGEEILEGISYEWSSTCSGLDCLVRGHETSRTVSARYLSAGDSGVHTCRAWDLAGCTGNASITVTVVGTGMYAEPEDMMLPDNGLTTTGGALHCVTGSSTPNPGQLIDPHGEIIDTTDAADTSDGLSISHGVGALHADLGGMVGEEMGIYTCKLPDETGKEVDMNVGIYSPETASAPVVSAIEPHPFSSSLYTLSCISHGSPPTQVFWERDGVPIDIEGSGGYYSLKQTLLDRLTSTYNSTLTISAGAEEAIGEYACTVNNTLGTSNRLTRAVQALEVSGHESPVLVGLSRSINCSTHLEVTRMEWVLVGVGNPEPVTERVDGGQLLVLSLSPETTGLDGAMFVCRVTSKSGTTFEKTITVAVKALQNIITLSGPPSPLIAGGTYTLTCHVYSDLPPSVRWTDGNGNEITSSEGDIFVSELEHNGFNSTLSLTFDPLKTSHGARYTCVSVIAVPFSQEERARDVIVEIPLPTVTILRTPNTDVIYTTDTLQMVCIVTIHPSVEETPTDVLTHWTGPTGSRLLPGGNIQVYSEMDSPEFRLTANFSSLASHSYIFSGRYVCSSHVQPNASHPFVISSEVVNATTTFTVALDVSIRISYTTPDEYPDYAPPNYRPASSVSLTCEVRGAVGSVTYAWSSSCSSCFASSNYSKTISESFLRSRDAGTHTCTVTDANDSTGSASIPMNIVGIGLHTLSYGAPYRIGNNPNNTYAVPSRYGSVTRRLSFFCCTNSTAPSYANFRLPQGTLYNAAYSGSSYSVGNYFYLTRYTSGSYAGCLEVNIDRSSWYSYYCPYNGIYTCRVPDSSGVAQEAMMELNAYGSNSEVLYSFYRVPSTESLTFNCLTRTKVPTNLRWLKDGVNIKHNNEIVYRVSQQVTNYQNSYYTNTLMVTNETNRNDIAGTYSCQFGYSTRNVVIKGLEVQSSANYSDLQISSPLTLNCSSDLDISSIQWYRGDTLMSSVTDRSYSVITHTSASVEDDGLVYMCVVNGPYLTQRKNVTLSVTIPNEWATVSNSNSTGENALNNTNYTLTCTVTVIEGMTLPVTVEWVGPDGGVVTSEGNRMVGEVEVQGTVSTLSLFFSPVFSSDGGSYTCRATISVSWMKSQPPQQLAVVNMPVTTQSLFQLKLYPLPLCVNWDVDKALDLERSIKRDVEKAVRERCDCDFSSSAIYSGEFSCQFTSCKSECDQAAHVTYRAVLNGTSDLLPADQLMQHIQDWRETRGTLLYNVFRLRLASDSECSINIETFEDEEC